MTGNARNGERHAYAKRMMERADDLRNSPALAPPPTGVGAGVSLEQTRRGLAAQRRGSLRVTLACLLALVVVALFSLHLPYYSMDWAGNGTTVYTTQQVLSCYQLAWDLHVAPLFDSSLLSRTELLRAQFPDLSMYRMVITRAGVTGITVICGFLLSVSGLLFQSSFRNPLATPSMLGVADGVSLGCIVYVFCGYSYLSQNPTLYVVCLYGCGALTLVVVLVLARLISGGRNYSVFDMLLIGTVISQLLGGFVSYVTNFVFDYNTWELFYAMQQATDALFEPITYAVVVVVALLTALPVFFLRFRLNLVSYSNADGRMLGAHPGALRAVALGLGSLMQLAAIASIGQVAMVSLAVPFLVRYLFRNEFRSQLLGNFLVGSIVLLLCSCIQSFAVFSTSFGMVSMPLGTIISFFIMPFFVWMMALQRRGWE